MIFIPCTHDYEVYAKRLVKSLPRSLLTCIVRYEDRGTWLANTLEKPVAAFLSAVDRFRKLGDVWIFDADLVYTGRESLEPLFATLEGADMAVHRHITNESWRGPDQALSAGVVGFAPTPVGFASFAWWAHACLTWGGDQGIRYPEQFLLWHASENALDMGGVVSDIDIRFNARPQSADGRDGMWDLPDDEIVLSHTPASRVERARKK